MLASILPNNVAIAKAETSGRCREAVDGADLLAPERRQEGRLAAKVSKMC